MRNAVTCHWRVASQRLSSSVASRKVASARFKQACLLFNNRASVQRLILPTDLVTDVYVLKVTLSDSMVLNLVSCCVVL